MQPSNRLFFQKWRNPTLVFLASLVVFLPAMYAQIFLWVPFSNDFSQHTEWARALQNDPGSVPAYVLAHSAWQILVVLVHWMVSSFETSALLVTVASLVLTTCILYAWIRPTVERRGLPPWLNLGLAIALGLVTPISLLFLADQKFYLGYIGMASYQNPTIILLRPFAILQFIYAVRCFRESSFSGRQVAMAAGISLLSAFIKPSFAICILPTIGLAVLYQLRKKRAVQWPMVLFGFVLPTVIMLGWQYVLTYYSNDDHSRVLFSPFGVMNAYSDYLPEKFLLSLGFPLLVSTLYFKKALRDLQMVMAWTAFLFGAFFTYFLAESGKRFLDGNFAWSGEIAMIVLFCACTLFFIENLPEISSRFQRLTVTLVWAMHAVFGVIYYFYCLLGRTYW